NGGDLSTEMFNMYGSSMLGGWKLSVNMETMPPPANTGELERGNQEFYFSNHLGNNLVILSDRKEGIQDTGNPTQVTGYEPYVLSATDYSAYGENLIGREYNPGKIKFGFNGKWNDFETGYQDYGMRMSSSKRRGFVSVDPLKKDYPYYSTYQFSGNNPIKFIDLDGGEPTAPKEDLKNVRITNHVDKGNIIEGYYDPNDRLHLISVEKLYDPIKKQAFFIHEEKGKFFFWNSPDNILQIKRNADGTSTANGQWEEYETYEQRQGRIRAGAPNALLALFGVGLVVPMALITAPALSVGVASYGAQAATASMSSRLIAGSVNVGFQYIQNAPAHGFGF